MRLTRTLCNPYVEGAIIIHDCANIFANFCFSPLLFNVHQNSLPVKSQVSDYTNGVPGCTEFKVHVCSYTVVALIMRLSY